MTKVAKNRPFEWHIPPGLEDENDKMCKTMQKEAPDEPAEKPFERAVFTALGRASTCWEPMNGTGVFDSTTAEFLGNFLLAQHRRIVANALAAQAKRHKEEMEKLNNKAFKMGRKQGIKEGRDQK